MNMFIYALFMFPSPDGVRAFKGPLTGLEELELRECSFRPLMGLWPLKYSYNGSLHPQNLLVSVP